MILTYITVLAWIVGVLSTILFIIRVHDGAVYTDLEKSMDAIKGQKVSFPIKIPGALMIVSWSWIITQFIVGG